MRHLFGLLVGLTLGVAVGAALIYFNPLILDDVDSRPAAGAQFSYTLDGGGLLVSRHDVVPGMPLTAGRRPALWERGIRGTLLDSFVVVDADGLAAAVATKLAVPSPDSDAVQSGLLTEDQWLVTLPGRGSLVVAGRSNIWPMLRDSVVRVDLLKRDWQGPRTYGMLRGGAAEVTGASGDYRGVRGVLTETVSLDDYPRTGFAGLAGRIGIAFDADE